VNLQGIHSGEIIDTVHARRAPMLPVSATLGSDPHAALLIVQATLSRSRDDC
jgi:hypothetical protein